MIHIEGERGLEMNATATKLSSAQKSAKNAMTDHLSNNTVPNSGGALQLQICIRFKPDYSAHSYEENYAETVTKGGITTITTDTHDV